MTTTYDVRVFSLEVRQRQAGATYRVLWKVAGQRRTKTLPTRALADSFRSELLAAARKGEPFDVVTGRPAHLSRSPIRSVSWYQFSCSYIDAKWPQVSPHHRKGIAECLASVTVALLTEPVSAERAKQIRSALLNWGYNARRGDPAQPVAVEDVLTWVEGHTHPVTDLAQPAVTRRVLEHIALRVDGSRAGGRTAAWKRSVFSTALNRAVEDGLLATNPVTKSSWRPPRSVQAIDRRSVVNIDQARALLEAVRNTATSGPRLHAFFASLYYSALRPEEAVALHRQDLDLPDEGWGWLTLSRAAPEVDRQWSDGGVRREARELKHRARGETRRVPCPPELADMLRAHLADFGTAADGRVFSGVRGAALAGVTYNRVWDRARQAALTPEQYASSLAARPYDLRHAAVSTWLNSGVPPTQVAAWAGHSVHVLMRIYAKCIDGQERDALRKIDEALGRLS